MEWKISLPTQPVQETPSEDAAPEGRGSIPASDREELVRQMSAWLGEEYVESLTDADVVVLSASLARLSKTRSDDHALWTAVPDPSGIPRANEAILAYETLRAASENHKKERRRLMERFGLDPSNPPERNARTANDLFHRYEAILAQVDEAGRSLRECDLVEEPSLADILFLSDVLPSLLAADVELIADHPTDADSVSEAMKAATAMDAAAAAMKEETDYDPGAHAIETLSGIRRALATRKASDFVTAFSMFGVSFPSAEKAQKASGLMKEYFAAADAFAKAAGASPRQRLAMRARLDLDASISRRVAILADGRISPALKELARGTHVARLTRLARGLGPDARRIVEENLPDSGPAPAASALVEHLREVSSSLIAWSETTLADLVAVGGNADNHMALEQALADTRRELAKLGDFVLAEPLDVDHVQCHIAWLREATLLPVSDTALDALFKMHGKAPLPSKL